MRRFRPRDIRQAARRLMQSRLFSTAFLAVALMLSLFAILQNTSLLYITDDRSEEGFSALSLRDEPIESVLARQGIPVEAEDSIIASEASSFYRTVRVQRARTATLIVDGKEIPYTFGSATVGDLLAANHITLSDGDYCSAPEAMALCQGDVITVTQAEKRIVTRRVSIPYQTDYKISSLLSTGKTRLVAEGEDGLAEETWEELWSGDECLFSTLISSREIIAPTNAVMLQGQAGVPISRLDWSEEYPLDENGIPLEYVAHHSGCKATGYSAKERSYGAGGGYCYCGTVAVIPSKYPYGTKLYIRSADGRFVYGYALCNDTGNLTTVDVDLFYETYRESALNSLRTVEIYVLEWGNGTMYQ